MVASAVGETKLPLTEAMTGEPQHQRRGCVKEGGRVRGEERGRRYEEE